MSTAILFTGQLRHRAWECLASDSYLVEKPEVKSRHFIFQPTSLENESLICYILKHCCFKVTKISVLSEQGVCRR